jgi:hypothetical protein
MPLKLFHRCYAEDADTILRVGFKEGTGTYLTSHEHSGVWLSNIPLDANEGAFGDTILGVELDLSEKELGQFEWIEEDKGYREFLIPAELVNGKAKVRVIEND